MTLEEKRQRYAQLGHAVQSGVAQQMEFAGKHFQRDAATEAKHIRVGLNLRACDHAAIAKLLIDKGIITEDEYFDSMIEMLEREVAMYEKELTDKFGVKITLA